jgi:multimeric flavodoxin WrbA
MTFTPGGTMDSKETPRAIKKTLIINGSTRVNGNTDTLMKQIIRGTDKKGINLKTITLRKKRISQCIGCYYCSNHENCSINDDMREIYKDINDSDLIVFMSPLYWWGVTGLMKTFIDRLFFYYPPRNLNLIAGKKVLVITPLAETNVKKQGKLLREFYYRLFKWLKLEMVDMFFFSGIEGKGIIKEKPDYLKIATSLGEQFPAMIDSQIKMYNQD